MNRIPPHPHRICIYATTNIIVQKLTAEKRTQYTATGDETIIIPSLASSYATRLRCVTYSGKLL